MKRSLSIIGILCSIFAGALNWSIVNMAAPSIQTSLDASLTNIQWLLNVFGLSMVPFLVLMGRLADVFGRKKIFLIGNFLFLIPSIFGGMSTSIYQLIFWRGMQGFASAIILPITQVLITKEFPENQHGRSIGYWMLTIGLGCGLGPLLGGILISLFSWEMIFYFNIPFFLAGLILSALFTKETKDDTSSNHLDIPGNITLIFFLTSLVYAIIEGPNAGWLSFQILVSFGIALFFGITFCIIEMKSKNPIIEFHFYLNERFLSASIGAFYTIFFVWAIFFLMPLYIQNILGFQPYQAGLILLLITAPFSILSPLVGYLEHKIRPKYFILLGIICYTIFTLLCLKSTAAGSFSFLIPMLIAFGIGWAVLMGPCVAAGISSLPPSKAGIAAGSLNTVQEIGGGVGLAIIGSTLRNVGQNSVFSSLDSKGITFSDAQRTEIKNQLSNPSELLASFRAQNISVPNDFEEIINTGFLDGMDGAMYILLALSAATFLFILFFMKKATRPMEKDIRDML